MLTLFGKRRKTRSIKKSGKKPSAKTLMMCKKLKIKTTKKSGKKRVYRKESVLKKLIAKKLKKNKTKTVRRRRSTTRFRFGFGYAPFSNTTSNYDYNQPVVQKQGTLPQTSQVVTASTNGSRPVGLTVGSSNVPSYGVGRPFFTETVPTQVGPRDLMFMGQPDGTLYPVGGPFVGYKTPAFGKKRRARKYSKRN